MRAHGETFKTANPGPGGVPITGPWQFHTGDNAAWASLGFDDFGGSAIGVDEPWRGQGHPRYNGFAWYRRHIEIDMGGVPLGVFVPPTDGAYEVYWNGKLLGSLGNLPPHALRNGQDNDITVLSITRTLSE